MTEKKNLGKRLKRFIPLYLMMIPGANRRVDKASKEEDKADKQYDTGHATVKSMSFTHTGCLTHKRFLEVYPKMGDGGIKAQERGGVN